MDSIVERLDLPTLEVIQGDPYATLERSLFDVTEGPDEPDYILRQSVVIHAHDLASRLLPKEVVWDIGLHYENMTTIQSEIAPNIRALFLLIRSYDMTQDHLIKVALEHILLCLPPALCDELCAAFWYTMGRDGKIMDEYQRILCAVDYEIDAELKKLPVEVHSWHETIFAKAS